jgi:carbon monoxide dehydrogenase subunit G
MPRREATFPVNAPPEAVWRFLRDFHALCSCIPGVERIQVLDERSAEITVREKVGIVPLIVTLTACIESEEPPRRLHAIARAEHLTMAIDVTLRGTAAGTELTSLFDVRGERQLKAIVDRLFERKADERAAQFAECLGQRFAAAPAARAAPPRAAGLRRWLARLWRRLRDFAARAAGKQ